MSRPGSVIYGLTPRCCLVVTSADVEEALTRARLTALTWGYETPAEVTSVITDVYTETTCEVWSDISHEEAVRWIQGREQRRTSVFAVVSSD